MEEGPVVLDSSLYLGAHIGYSSSYNLVDCLKDGVGYYCNAAQVFMSARLSIRGLHKFSTTEAKETQKYLDFCDVRLCTHAPYTLSLTKTLNESIDHRNRLQNEVIELYKLRNERWTPPVVFHPGSAGKGCTTSQRLTALDNLCSNLSSIDKELLHHICLEPPAGEGAKLPSTWNELKYINNKVPDARWCLDTCHLCGSKMADLSTEEGVDKFIEDVRTSITWDKVLVVHLNDSQEKLGSRKDRHERIGCGEIWSKNRKPIKKLLKFLSQKQIMCIGEGSLGDGSKDESVLEDIIQLRKMVK